MPEQYVKWGVAETWHRVKFDVSGVTVTCCGRKLFTKDGSFVTKGDKPEKGKTCYLCSTYQKKEAKA